VGHTDNVGDDRSRGKTTSCSPYDIEDAHHARRCLCKLHVPEDQRPWIAQLARDQFSLFHLREFAVKLTGRQCACKGEKLIQRLLMFVAVLTDIERSQMETERACQRDNIRDRSLIRNYPGTVVTQAVLDQYQIGKKGIRVPIRMAQVFGEHSGIGNILTLFRCGEPRTSVRLAWSLAWT
jgi:hypothetical protein